MTTTFKNILENIFVDVEGANIPLRKSSHKQNTVPKANTVRSFRTIGDMEHGKFRRMFDRHKAAFGY